jgi:hypothetical protein
VGLVTVQPLVDNLSDFRRFHANVNTTNNDFPRNVSKPLYQAVITFIGNPLDLQIVPGSVWGIDCCGRGGGSGGGY